MYSDMFVAPPYDGLQSRNGVTMQSTFVYLQGYVLGMFIETFCCESCMVTSVDDWYVLWVKYLRALWTLTKV